MHKVYLLTGSNVGNSKEHLKTASEKIAFKAGKILKQSSLYQTEPWGNKAQDKFLNQVMLIDTELEPHTLMTTLLLIESEMGRQRNFKWEPRVIDIDILFYDQLVLNDDLKIPHPLLHERRFTLEPLNEIAPELIHPVFGKPVSELLLTCPDSGVVEKL